MFCPNCGNETKEGAKFCAGCGAPVQEEPQEIFCASCGDKLKPEDKFCPKCGTPCGQNAAQTAQIPAAPISHNLPPVEDGKVLLEFNFNSTSFRTFDHNGMFIPADKVFTKRVSVGTIVADLFITDQWYIKLQIMKTQVRFIRLGTLNRPTDYLIKVGMNDILSVKLTHEFTFFNKTEITLMTRTYGKILFDAPKKKREEAAFLLQQLSGAGSGGI